jgi:hypothetical protein
MHKGDPIRYLESHCADRLRPVGGDPPPDRAGIDAEELGDFLCRRAGAARRPTVGILADGPTGILPFNAVLASCSTVPPPSCRRSVASCRPPGLQAAVRRRRSSRRSRPPRRLARRGHRRCG